MTKRQLIDEIVSINQSARPAFLAGFGDDELNEYLRHLQVTRKPRLSGNWRQYEKYFTDLPAPVARRVSGRIVSGPATEPAAGEDSSLFVPETQDKETESPVHGETLADVKPAAEESPVEEALNERPPAEVLDAEEQPAGPQTATDEPDDGEVSEEHKEAEPDVEDRPADEEDSADEEPTATAPEPADDDEPELAGAVADTDSSRDRSSSSKVQEDSDAFLF